MFCESLLLHSCNGPSINGSPYKPCGAYPRWRMHLEHVFATGLYAPLAGAMQRLTEWLQGTAGSGRMQPDGAASFGRFHCIFSGPQVQRPSDAALLSCCHCCAAQAVGEGLQSRAALCSSFVRLLLCEEDRWKLACVLQFAYHIS